jgi:hypothetical protein
VKSFNQYWQVWHKNGKITIEISYFINAIGADAKDFANAVAAIGE